jgi:ERCC4-type nuclease
MPALHYMPNTSRTPESHVTPPTDLPVWIFAFNIFQFFQSTGLGIYVWFSNKEKVTNTRFAAQDERITKIETDMKLGKAKIETDAKLADERHEAILKQLEGIGKELARHADCKYHQGFEVRLDDMNGSIRKVEGIIEGRMEGIGSALDMIQQHLLNGGK